MNQQTYHTTLGSVFTFDYTDSMSKVKHISVLFVHKETLNLEYVNKTRGVTLIIGNLLKQQDIVVKISYSKEDMAHIAKT